MEPKRIYLCYPFSHPLKIVRWWRWFRCTMLTAKMMKRGHIVYSPITHSYPVSLFLGNSLSYDFWLKQDFSYLDKWADMIAIPVDVPAWENSKGIWAELDRFVGEIRPVLNNGEVI